MIPIVLVMICAAGPSPQQPPLELARDLLTEGRVEEGIGVVRELRRAGGLDAATLAEAYLLEGMGLALLDDSEATLAFHRALTLDPAVDPRVRQAVVREPFETAKRSWVDPGLRIEWRARGAAEVATPGLEVRLVHDTYGLVHGVRARRMTEPDAHGSEEASPSVATKLDVSAPLAFVPHGRAPLVVVDEHGNELRTLPAATEATTDSAADAQHAPDRFAFADYPWGTIAGAGVMSLGLVVAVGCGAMVAAYDRGLLLPDVIDPLARVGLLAGLGAGLLVVVAGGAGVVTDQLLFGELLTVEPPASAAPAESKGTSKVETELSTEHASKEGASAENERENAPP